MKALLVLFVSVVVLFLLPGNASAGIVDVSLDGEVVVNVLSYESERSGRDSIEVKRLFDGKIPIGDKINLSSNEGKAQLLVSSGGESYEADVTGFSGDIVEIEAKVAPKRVKVMYANGEFLIEQRGYTAKTQYPINIDASTREFSIRTEHGVTFLSVMPYDAVTGLVRAGMLTEIGENGKVDLSSDADGVLVYIAEGVRTLKFFKLLEISVPVVASVSATTGELSVVEQPVWLSVFGYFLS